MQTTETWQEALQKLLPLYGHRNWIVVADAAYPSQVSAGVHTVAGHDDHVAVLKRVLHEIDAARHVRPLITVDEELGLLDDSDAPGISAVRDQLHGTLSEYAVQTVPHEDVIGRLDAAGKLFGVLVIKTTMTLPYTSVFIELDCGYWNADAEKRLRSKMRPM